MHRPAAPPRSIFALASGTFALLLGLGCAKGHFNGVFPENARPTVSITDAPRAPAGTGTYHCEISWAGFDSDGRVVGFRYVIDPPAAANADTAWVSTTANREEFTFLADSVSGIYGRRFHTFVLQAIDDQAARSASAILSFDAVTFAPSVVITSPVPTPLLSAAVPTSVQITWTGADRDGGASKLPASYRWRLFTDSSVPSLDDIRFNPDTLRALFAPTFAGWDSLPGTATTVTIRNLTISHSYLFVIVAFDEAGAWSPVFSMDTNILRMRTDAASALGPRPTLWNDAFRYEFPYGGIVADPAFWPQVDFAAGVPIVIQWSAIVNTGSYVRGMRWALDLQRIDDETPRTDEGTDLQHWSRWSTSNTVVVPPIQPGPGINADAHFFYLELEDDAGTRTLVGVAMTVVKPSFKKPLLIIDDTAFRIDRRLANGCSDPPSGAWPTAAELDTFLYAVGNVPWRCYSAGTSSPPGAFAGYDFDTLGTHFLGSSTLSLGQLAPYRNIIWMVDGPSAVTYNNPWNVNVQPMPLFRALAAPGAYNPLVTWMAMGGRLWLMGGGAAYASLRDYDGPKPSNVFSSTTGELVPGRFMYSFAHWRSEVTTYYSFRASRSPRAIGGWPAAPDYSQLPPLLREKSSTTDPLPPGRTASTFYQTSYYAEYLSQPNPVVEPLVGMYGDSLVSTLDTLYTTQGGIAGSGWPVMTLYHGPGNPTLVFSGFPLWYFQRAQAIELGDFVLQKVFGMTRRPVAR